jgi:phosphinothricin acetyltransferase
MLVRDARLEDLSEVVAIYNEEIPKTTATWTEKLQTLDERIAWFKARSARNFPTVVAEVDAKVVGVAAFGDFRDSIVKEGYRFTVEHSVHVTESMWGKGVGRALMQRLFEEAKRRSVHAMIGGVDAANTGSIVFHERLGFREVARMPETGFKFGRWLDLVFVQRLFDEAAQARNAHAGGA